MGSSDDDDWVQVARINGRLYIQSYRKYQAHGWVAKMWGYPDAYEGRPAWNTLSNIPDYTLVRRGDLPGVLDMERARLAMEGT